MIRLLRFLFTGDWHLHEFETINSYELQNSNIKVGMRYEQKCKICGKIKRTDCVQ
jgi:hypothetical protein